MALVGLKSFDAAIAANALGHAYQEVGSYAQADRLLRQSLEAAQQAPGDHAAAVSKMQTDLGFFLWLESRDSESIAWFRKSLAFNPRPDEPEGAITRSLLSQVLERQGNLTEAWQLATQARDLVARREGPSFNLAITRHIVANFLRDRGDLQGAERAERENLALWRKVGGGHIDVLYAESNLGVILLTEGDWRQAEPQLRDALAARQSQLGDKHPLVAISLLNVGRMLEAKGDFKGAGAYFANAANTLRETIGPEGWSLENVLASSSLLALDRADYSSAESYAQQALDMTRKLGAQSSLEAAALMVDIGVAREFESNAAGAEAPFRQAIEIDKALLAPGSPALISAETRLGEALIIQGKPGLAEPILSDAAATAHKPPFPLLPWQIAEPENALAVCLAKLGHTSESANLLQHSGAALAQNPQSALRRWNKRFRAGI
jgi:tetratricopeptide (TPR) repeat protein